MDKKEIHCRIWRSDYDFQDLTWDEWTWLDDEEKLHRTNGPAYEETNGNKFWIQNSKNLDLSSSVEILSGGYKWYLNGMLHREDGPAIEWYNDEKEWYQNNRKHRINGPAVIDHYSGNEWWINGQELSHESVEMWIEENQIDLSIPEGQTAFVLRWS